MTQDINPILTEDLIKDLSEEYDSRDSNFIEMKKRIQEYPKLQGLIKVFCSTYGVKKLSDIENYITLLETNTIKLKAENEELKKEINELENHGEY